MTNKTLEEIEKDVYDGLLGAIGLSAKTNSTLKAIQPPATVVDLAAKAATAVIMAFERGYRLGS